MKKELPFQLSLNSFLFILFFLFLNSSFLQAIPACKVISQEDPTVQNLKIDSLLTVLMIAEPDTNKLQHLNALCWEYNMIGEYDSALFYGNAALALGNTIIKETKKAAVKYAAKKGIAVSYNNIGVIYMNTGNYEMALKNQISSLSIREEMLRRAEKEGNDYEIKACKIGMSWSFGNIGVIYASQGRNDKALENYLAALKLFEELKDSRHIADISINIGNIYFDEGNYDKALEKYFTSLKSYERTENKYGISAAYSSIGNIYALQKNYNKALQYFLKSLDIKKEIDDKQGIAVLYNNIGNLYLNQDKISEARKYSLLSLNIAEEIGSKDDIKEAYYSLSVSDSALGNWKGAFSYHQLYVSVKDTLLNEESSRQITEMQTKYESDKKEKAISLLTKEKEVQKLELNKKRILTYSFAGGLALVLLLVGVTFNGYRQKQKANDLLSVQNIAIVNQKHIIEEKNKDITDSIKYAKRIQEAILPSDQMVNKLLQDSFILYKPKDIVSGDFYFVSENSRDSSVIVAAVDCTGHGVPGAFMSIVGHNGLTRAVKEQGLSKPGDILNYLNKTINETLRQTFEESSIRDGMDICLISIRNLSSETIVEYAGAFNPLVIVKNNSLLEINADKQPIGAFIGDHQKPFTNKEVKVAKGDVLYLFTDGYADQFGGEKGKKLKYKKLKELLLEINHLQMNEQKKRLDDAFNSWRGDLEQVDDVCIIGIKV